MSKSETRSQIDMELQQIALSIPIIDSYASPILRTPHKPPAGVGFKTALARLVKRMPDSPSFAELRLIDQIATALRCNPSFIDVLSSRERLMDDEVGRNVWLRKCFGGIYCTLLMDHNSGGIHEGLRTVFEHGDLTTIPSRRILALEEVVALALGNCRDPNDTALQLDWDRWSCSFARTLQVQLRREDTAALQIAVCSSPSKLCSDNTDRTGREAQFTLNDLIAACTESQIQGATGKNVVCKSVHESLVAKACKVAEETGIPIIFMIALENLKNRSVHPEVIENEIERLMRTYHNTKFVLKFPSLRSHLQIAIRLANNYRNKNIYIDLGSADHSTLIQLLQEVSKNRLVWSSNGAVFPETFLSATSQARAVFLEILLQHLRDGTKTLSQCRDIMECIFFTNANRLYNLYTFSTTTSTLFSLPSIPYDELRSIEHIHSLQLVSASSTPSPNKPNSTAKHHQLMETLQSSNIKFVRLQWVDYINVMRLRILPISQLLKALEKGKEPDLKITAAVFSLTQNNDVTKKFQHGGIRLLRPDWSSLRSLWPNGRPSGKGDAHVVVHGSVMCDLRVEKMGEEIPWSADPRSLLTKKLDKLKSKHGVSLRLGFEIEVVLLPWDREQGRVSRESRTWGDRQAAHGWSSATALLSQNKSDIPVSRCIEEVSIQLEESGIEVLLLHPESTYGQFEFVLGVLEGVKAVDALYHARQIIEIVANQYGYRATLHPKPMEKEAGTGAHVHFSMFNSQPKEETKSPTQSNEDQDRIRQLDSIFVEGVLTHLRAFSAFCMPTLASYERSGAKKLNYSCNPWLCWGTDNKDAPLRMTEPGMPNQHWELRCVDGTANVYLLIAGLISAGLLGLEKRNPLRKAVNQNPDRISTIERKALGLREKLPTSLEEAFEALKADEEFCEEMGKIVVDTFLDVKEAEIETVKSMMEAGEDVWAWEVEHY